MLVHTYKKIIKKILCKYNAYINCFYIKIERTLLYNKVKYNKSVNNIYLFSNPIHSNLGDQAQTYCILKWFHEYYPDYTVICAPKKITTEKTLKLICKKITREDLLFIHSGYLIFDPHPELSYICDVVDLFHDRQIIILPQTVNLVNESIIFRVATIFNNHPNLILLCRDDISYNNAKILFQKCKLILWPDFVTSLIGTKSYTCKRNGILFCLRNDGEKLYSSMDLDKLKDRFDNVYTVTSDTTILKNAYTWKFNRTKLVNVVLEDFSKYQLVITDRYHGTIFSQITSTPVIVLSSKDHKLSSGVKWFPKEKFGENLFFAENLDVAYEIALKLLSRNGEIIENRNYFNEQYFFKLRHMLES